MKNIISIDATNDCKCDLLSSVDDGTNRIVLDIKADLLSNPILVMGGTQITITTSDFTYEIPNGKLAIGSTLSFYIKDDMHTGDNFKITVPQNVAENWLLKQSSNFIYTLSANLGQEELVPITDEQIDTICV